MDAKTFFTIVAIVVSLLLHAGCSQDMDKQDFFDRANSYLKKGNEEAAILELRSAIQLDPKFSEARYQLGLLYFSQGKVREAFSQIIRAADLAPDNVEINLKAAEMYILGRKPVEARQRIETILKNDSKHVEARALLSKVLLLEGQAEKALGELEKIKEPLESSDRLQNLLGQIHVYLKQWHLAEKAYLKAISLNKDNITNYKALLSLYEKQQRLDDSKTLLLEMMDQFPENTDAYLLYAGYLRRVGKIGEVEDHLKKVIELAPEKAAFRIQLADFYQQQGELQKAEDVLVSGHEQLGDNPRILAALATFYFNNKEYQKAQQKLKELNKLNEENIYAKLLEARFLFKEKEVRKGMEQLQKLTVDYPRWSEPFFYLAIGHEYLGEIDLAQKNGLEALRRNPRNVHYHRFQARLLLKQNDFEGAKKEATIGMHLQPNNLQNAITLAKSYMGLGEYEKALELLERINTTTKKNVEVLSALTVARLKIKQIEKAKESLGSFLDIDPGNPRANILNIQLNFHDNNEGAVTFLKAQIERAPKDHRLHFLLGSLYKKMGDDIKALDAVEKAIELKPQETQSYMAAAALLKKLDRVDEAYGKYESALKDNPKYLQAHMGIAALLQLEGRVEEAMEKYEEILRLDENFAPAANNLAWFLAAADDPNLGRALMLSMLAKNESPDDANVADTLGFVYLQRKSWSLAIAQFEVANTLKPNDPLLMFHLSQALVGDGQKEKASELLVQLLENHKDFPDRSKAEQLYREIKVN